MLFTITDKNFNRICNLPKAINIQWISRFYSCGQFSIQLPGSVKVTDDWHYILCDERQNTGIIQQRSYSQNVKGKFVQISGFFLEHELSDVIIFNYKPTSHYLKYQDYLYRRIGYMIDDCMKSKDSLFWYAERNGTESLGKYNTNIYDFEITNQDAMTAAYELSEINETSFIYYWDNGFKVFEILESKIRSNVIFLEHQLSDLSIIYDKSNYKNCVKVLGPIFNGEQIIAEYKSDEVTRGIETEKWIVLDNTGLSLVKNMADSSGIEYQQNYSKSEIIDIMINNAKTELLKYQYVINANYKIADFGNYEYLRDFCLGDIITVKIDSLGIEETRQIIEVEEVWKNNQHNIYLELGQSRQSIVNKAVRATSNGTVSKVTYTSDMYLKSNSTLKNTQYKVGKIDLSTYGKKTIDCGFEPKTFVLRSDDGSTLFMYQDKQIFTALLSDFSTNANGVSFTVGTSAMPNAFWEAYG